MALSDGENGIVMPVTPMGGYGNNGGFGFGGGDGMLAILFLFAMMGGWGGNGFGGNNQLPWLMAGQQGINANTNSGFDNAALSGQLSGIQSAISNGFQNSEVAACNRAMDAMQTAYSNQIASMNQSFANSQALNSQLDGISMGLQNCCCENRAGLADLKYTVATENCADRQALNEGVRDIISSQTAATQKILDKLCDQELQAERRENQNLRSELMYARGQASQTAQTARILADNSAQTTALEQYLNPAPIPAYMVQNPNCCAQNTCGCGGF